MLKLAFATAAAFAVASGTDLEGQYISDLELEHFNLVNEARAKGYTCYSGKTYAPNPTPLIFDCRLWRAARLHAIDMIEQAYFSHTSKDGTKFTERALAQGIATSGENMHMGYKMTAQSAVNAMKRSSAGHCDGMYNPNRLMFGVGSWDHWSNNWSKLVQMYYSGTNYMDTTDTSCIPGPGQTNEPTPIPTPRPTPPPVPTQKPTYVPTYETIMTVVCTPLADCQADADCFGKYVAVCATYGTHDCGMPAENTNDPETEFCSLDDISEADLVSICGPHPDDAAATWADCYVTWYTTGEQCDAGGEAKGLRCQWIRTPIDGMSDLMSIIYG